MCERLMQTTSTKLPNDISSNYKRKRKSEKTLCANQLLIASNNNNNNKKKTLVLKQVKYLDRQPTENNKRYCVIRRYRIISITSDSVNYCFTNNKNPRVVNWWCRPKPVIRKRIINSEFKQHLTNLNVRSKWNSRVHFSDSSKIYTR